MNTTEGNVVARTLVKSAAALAIIIYPLSRWLSFISMIATVAMMLVVTADVFMRRAFNSPIFGAFDVIKILLVIIVFCAISHVMRVREHIVVDSITRLYPQKYNRVVNGVAYLFSMVILALMCWQSFRYGLAMVRVGEKLVLLKIAMSPFIFTVAFGYAIFFLVVMVQWIIALAGADENTGEMASPYAGGYGQH
jgi:TRAP-type C4-dicarboxylate transport system permease small subunit